MNWSNKILFCFLFLILITINIFSFGQTFIVEVTKKQCNYNKIGEKLIINYLKDTSNIQSGVEYWLDEFIKESDTVKLMIIEKLLNFEGDTSLCCMNVLDRSFNGIEGCAGKPSDVSDYSIQIDALYMINRLCWPQWMELYSCVPVLYDTKLKVSINEDSDKIKRVFADYKEWFKEMKSRGKISNYFPFNEGRYIWYGGRRSGVTKEY